MGGGADGAGGAADRFYLISLIAPPADTAKKHHFTIDHELTYEPFHRDFGPLNMAMLYRYTMRLGVLLSVGPPARKPGLPAPGAAA